MRHRKPKRRRPSRIVYAALVPCAFAMTWKEPAENVLSPAPHRPPHRDHGPSEAGARPAAPRPGIVARRSWNADEGMVREKASTMRNVRAVFVHHTSQPNDYECKDVPRLLRQLEAEHVERGWDDLGYNFVVDHCGTIYEGRAGARDHSVEGAHTKGFNAGTIGVAAVGTFDEGAEVPRAMLDSIAALAAWKLKPGVDARGTTQLVSSSSESRFDKGDRVRFRVITGHRDAYETFCPGEALYDKLGYVRDKAARLRERAGSGRNGRPRPPHSEAERR
ncbi:N-acetylmuramoyl-L-alanine amidase [Streptomyces sp. HNM0575]|uniref:N-acetylmuramoyl-L-alanine amidase n=1 Tax=Streptomyces sp. HNM0575 TaxID=2716338 RepID=UPI00145D83D6|nr:N-acetylmuramoyl-L-alanine amidase [Streptomyces sp. HNM0575]NLU75487.1 N-acetylmuramoyl-L-alanine amidase [Streptomyces sp. HNM0575]